MEQINKLIAEQQKLADELSRKLSNMKKDSKVRKTEKYLDDRCNDVESLWQRFSLNHTDILELDVKKETKYAKSDFYDEVEELYNKARTHIYECQEALNSSKENKCWEIKLIEQARRIEILKADLESAKQATDGFAQYLEDIKKQFTIIVDNDVEFCRIPTENRDSKYFKENWFQRIRQKYREGTVFLDKKIRERAEGGASAASSSSGSNCNLILPKLKIPIFSGKYDEWPTFQDIFTKVIDTNKNVSKVEKMQYLKTYVKGEAKDAIQHFEITESNYDSAWKELRERYDNKRRIVNRLIQKILHLPVMQAESAEPLKNMYNTIKECMEALKMQQVDTSSWDAIIVCIVTEKWDSRTNELFETSLEDSFQIQSLETMLKFMLKRFQAMEAAGFKEKGERSSQKTSSPNKTNCKYCNNTNHAIYTCAEFKALSSNDRFKFVKDKKLCFNCLNHDFGKKCFSSSKCRTCEKNHHTLIHTDRSSQDSNKNKNVNDKTKSQGKSVKVSNNLAVNDETALLATALVKVRNARNMFEYLRALIDPGSQASFVTEEAAVLLGLPREKVHAEITGLGDTKPKISTQKIRAVCRGRTSSSYNLQCDLYVLSKLTSITPEREVNFAEQDWQNNVLADPTFFKPGPIDIILGTKEYREILLDGIKKTQDGSLGQNTELGWIVFGTGTSSPNNEIKIQSMVTQTQEENDISKFWELEEVQQDKNMNNEEEFCEKFYKETTIRQEDGTYAVKIPFKTDEVELGESRSRSVARLMQLEKRLLKQEQVNNEYKEFMQTYIDLGHMKIVPKSEERTGKYYIPHQCVIREESSTTKLRVVFDASCKTSNGKSLNDVMMTGPRIQQELTDILIRWRSNKIAFTADIEKMYRQIKMSEDDQDFQRIVWRFKQDDPIREYRLTTVTYGTASAPYLAVKTIQQLAKDEEKTFQRASKVAIDNCYVDDVLSGADNEKDAISLQQELIQMFKAGGFNLRKWCSNNAKLMEETPSEMREKQIVLFDENELKKSLGVYWAPFDDTIRFRVEISNINKLTKRVILSNVAKLFDPLGLLSPIVVTAKLIIQELWKNDLKWDEDVPKPISENWSAFYNKLKGVEEITIPRWTRQTSNSNQEVHGFCDASEKAIGAVIYVRTTNPNNETEVTLLVAKSKVAPIKTKTTLPRLELCAAVLLSKLMNRVIKAFANPKWEIFAWTDSMITLSWIKGDISRWKTFVSNRVSEIHQLTGQVEWNHVGTKENPADIISRGMDPEKLKTEILWWKGPQWLKNDKNHWPKQQEIQSTKIEAKKSLQVKTHIKSESIYKKFSSLKKAIRIIAYCLRFSNNCKNKDKKQGSLSVKELDESLNKIIKEDQQDTWCEEVSHLKQKTHVKKRSILANLHPFIDKDGVMRVGGRLKHSLLKYTEKHPVIIEGKSDLAEMIVREAHLCTLHGGNQQTLAYIRRKYWIVNAKKLVKRIINKCTTCIRYRAKTAEQLMGQLPATRVIPASAFINTGVDYAGPISVRTTKGRGHKSYKGYIAIFVCLTTKAVHLEVVSDMTTEAFFAALKRFTGRRGTCTNMYSDNGTTFIGTSKMMEKEIITLIKRSNIQDKLANTGIQWHFIPPSAPHFGGIWEAGVKSMKNHLKRVIGETTLTYEELSTLMHEIEACLNSRPLCPLTDEINDIAALTPGHFLIGRELLTPANPVEIGETMDLTGRWRLIQKMRKDFWKIWSTEYLQQLQVMNKWKLENDNLSIGDVVLVKDDNLSPSRWPLARIQEVHEDKEGLVRVVTIKKAEGAVTKRPIHKLVPLTTEKEADTRRSEKLKKKNPKASSKGMMWRVLTIAIMFTLHFGKAHGTPNYHIEKPNPGLYVEHLGKTRIDRGLFRIEMKINEEKLEWDMNCVYNITKKIADLCMKMQVLTADIECKSLIEQLEEEEKNIHWMKKGIEGMRPKRFKRGVWGTVLTSIFGVNDEVYREIDDLDKNQQELIQASNHQTKFMLQALAKFNDTEVRVNRKLKEFKSKLNKGLAVIEGMHSWYKTVDQNRLEIHLLSVYEVAKSYLDELERHYKSILNILTSKENLYEIMSPAHIGQIISDAMDKLPSNIKIMSHPIVKTEIEQKDNVTSIFGYFSIAEITEYNLIKANSVPLKIENGSYWILDVSTDIIAIDYNGQKYFEMSDDELRNCIIRGNNVYICSPAIIRSIENDPNCVIDELYQRNENSLCSVHQHKFHNMIWKKLYTSNTWMFITERKTKIAIICNGEREETDIEQTGIIAISQACIIATKRSILTPKRMQTVPVVAGYSKPVAVNLTTSKTKYSGPTLHDETEIEPYDNLKDLELIEENIQTELHEKHWKKITHHSAFTSGITTISIIAVVIITAIGFKILKERKKRKRITQKRNSQTREEIEMKPLNKAESTDPLRDVNIPGLIDNY